jgi:folylpolyglutamate synthase/dihydrofolate synthase
MNPSEALEWLYSTQLFGIKLGLENTRRLLAAVGHPEEQCRFLHVAGTNGKGSVCAMLDSILRAAGHRTGLYTSPHLVDFRERIRVNGVEIPESAMARILTQLRDCTSEWSHAPTFFELATVLALRHFADEGAEFVVLETGMGGRLDATNAVTPIVSVLTPIAMDHSQWLGGTLEAIAAEKAGILKSGVPAVSARQEAEVSAVIEDRAAQIGAPLQIVDAPIPEDWSVRLAGSHQRANAALAVATIRAAKIDVPVSAMEHGLARVEWAGRFQRVGNFVLDGGHNPHAAERLVATWREVFGDQKATVIFGALEDKDYATMLRLLGAIAKEIWVVPVKSMRSTEVSAIERASPVETRAFPDLRDALAEAGALDEPLLITGSLFLVGEALEILRPDDFIPGGRSSY